MTHLQVMLFLSRQAVDKIKKRVALKFIDEYKLYNNL